MEIREKRKGDVVVVSISGSIDALTAPEVTKQFEALGEAGNYKIAAVFSEVEYTSSAGLRVLLGAVKMTRSNGGDFFLVDVPTDILKVLNLSGFTSILKIFPDLDTALQNFE